MIAYVVRRLFQSVIVLVVVAFIAFCLTFLGDPVAGVLGTQASPEARAALAEDLGINDPFLIRYARFMGDAVRGDFGISFSAGKPVLEMIGTRLPATIELGAVAMFLSLVIGIALGLYAAIRRRSTIAKIIMTTSLIGVSLPPFLIAILLIFAFGVSLGWLPTFGRGETVNLWGWETGLLTTRGIKALILPALSLAIPQITLNLRLVRSEMLEVLLTDYIRFARARGLHDRIINLRHAFRNTLVPLVTIAGLQIGFLMAYAVVVEVVFQWPGMGLLFIQALQITDIPVISAFLLMTGFVFVMINLVVDMLYFAIDPRLRSDRAVSLSEEGIVG